MRSTKTTAMIIMTASVYYVFSIFQTVCLLSVPHVRRFVSPSPQPARTGLLHFTLKTLSLREVKRSKVTQLGCDLPPSPFFLPPFRFSLLPSSLLPSLFLFSPFLFFLLSPLPLPCPPPSLLPLSLPPSFPLSSLLSFLLASYFLPPCNTYWPPLPGTVDEEPGPVCRPIPTP